MNNLEHFGRFAVCQSAGQAPITFPRVPEEVVCLGYDPVAERLAELHVLRLGEEFPAEQKKSFIERARNAATMTGACFQRILTVEEDQGMFFYATTVNDGEFLNDYVLRSGGIDRAISLALILGLVEATIQLQPHRELLLGMQLNSLMVTLSEESLLTLRIIDLGLARDQNRLVDEYEVTDLIAEISKVLFFMLGGRPWLSGQKGQIEGLTGVSADLKVILKNTLTENSSRFPSLESYRAEIDQVLNAAAPRRSGSPTTGPLAVSNAFHPRFSLKRQLFPGYSLDQAMEGAYSIIPDKQNEVYSALAEDLKNDRKVTLQLLPSSATVPLNISSQIAAEFSKIKSVDHPMLIKPLGFQEEERGAFVLEEVISGFSLLQLVKARIDGLEPAECIVLLTEIDEALSQAEAATVSLQSLTIHSLAIHFPKEPARRFNELKIRRMEHWPDYLIKLRCHPSLRSLTSSPPRGQRKSQGTRSIDRNSEAIRVAEGFMGIAEVLLQEGRPEQSEVAIELRQVFREQYKVLDDEFSRKDFIDRLAQNSKFMDGNQGNEKVGTIVDGAPLTATKVPPKSRKPLVKPIPDQNQEVEVEALGVIDDEAYDLPTESPRSKPKKKKKKRFLWG